MDRGTIIFDFDGTIADSFEVVLELFYELTGHERFTPEEITAFRRLPIRRVLKEVNVSLRHGARLLMQGRTMMRQRMQEVRVIPGLHHVLAELHQSGWRLMVVSSNSQQNVAAYLETHDLSEYFDQIHGGVGLFSKTQSLRKVIRQNKLTRESCFYVGDEVRDVQAANKAHVRCVAVGWGYNDVPALRAEKPFALAEKPTDLIQVFTDTGMRAN